MATHAKTLSTHEHDMTMGNKFTPWFALVLSLFGYIQVTVLGDSVPYTVRVGDTLVTEHIFQMVYTSFILLSFAWLCYEKAAKERPTETTLTRRVDNYERKTVELHYTTRYWERGGNDD